MCQDLDDFDQVVPKNDQGGGGRQGEAPRARAWNRSAYDEHLAANESDPKWVWCLVANVVGEHPFGEDHRIVYGTKHFRGGTKVYCLLPRWGGFDQIPVIGKPRGKHGLREVIMHTSLLRNFRLKKVYSPAVIRRICKVDEDGYKGHAREAWSAHDGDKEAILSLLRWVNLDEEQLQRYRTVCNCPRLELACWIPEDPDSLRTIIITRTNVAERQHDDVEAFSGHMWDGELSASYLPCPLRVQSIAKDIHTFDRQNGYASDVNESFLQKLSDLDLHLWDECYIGSSDTESGAFGWRITVGAGSDYFRPFACVGSGSCPKELGKLFSLLGEYGFPKIWDDKAMRPLPLTEEQSLIARYVNAYHSVMESTEATVACVESLLGGAHGDAGVLAAQKLMACDKEAASASLTKNELAAIWDYTQGEQ